MDLTTLDPRYWTIASFGLGLVSFWLISAQWSMAHNNQYIRGFFSSLAIGGLTFIRTNFAVLNPTMYWWFTFGAAFGTSAGIYFGNRGSK